MENSPLAKLPPELRNCIYEEVLVSSEVIFIESRISLGNIYPRVKQGATPALSTVLLRVCRAIYAESCHILYSDNVFSVRHGKTLRVFLSLIGKENSGSLREVVYDRRSYGAINTVSRSRTPLAWMEQDMEALAEEAGTELGLLHECMVRMKFTVGFTQICLDLSDLERSWAQALPCMIRSLKRGMRTFNEEWTKAEIQKLQNFGGKGGRLDELRELFG